MSFLIVRLGLNLWLIGFIKADERSDAGFVAKA
jgi:hypothetical protein